MLQGWIHIVPKDWWPWLMVAAGVVTLIIVVLLVFVIVRQRRALSDAGPRMTPGQQRMLERDVSNLLRDLSAMAREVGAQLDARAVRLEELIRDADERMERLEEVTRAAAARSDATPSPLPMHPALLPVDGEVRSNGRLSSLADDRPDDRHVEIYMLADQGLAMQDIAQRLRRPNGEVELILALRPQSSRPARS